MSIEGLFEIFSKVEGVSTGMLPTYKERFIEHNINGKVLLHCDLDDLKKVSKRSSRVGLFELIEYVVVNKSLNKEMISNKKIN